MNVLVSGAGVAGLALATNLGTRGHQVTVVERAAHLRSTGSPIDIRGDAIEIADKMGLLTQLRDHRLRATASSEFVDSDDRPIVRVPMERVADSADDIEIARDDLARILADALPDDATVRFQDSIDALAEVDEGVDVQFRSGRTGRFDLVIGADGLHSAVRRLAFGPEQDYLRHLGMYVAIMDLPAEVGIERLNPMYNYPGHLAGILRYKQKALGILMFRSPLLDFDYHDLDAQKKIILDAFAGHPHWKVPELLDAVRADPECYFDSVSQIHLPTWHTGRVALVGDAAHCAALLSGRGTSLALTGAYFLAEELEKAGGDHKPAFTGYELRQRPYVEFAQASVDEGSKLVVPETWQEIDARNEDIRSAAIN